MWFNLCKYRECFDAPLTLATDANFILTGGEGDTLWERDEKDPSWAAGTASVESRRWPPPPRPRGRAQDHHQLTRRKPPRAQPHVQRTTLLGCTSSCSLAFYVIMMLVPSQVYPLPHLRVCCGGGVVVMWWWCGGDAGRNTDTYMLCWENIRQHHQP